MTYAFFDGGEEELKSNRGSISNLTLKAYNVLLIYSKIKIFPAYFLGKKRHYSEFEWKNDEARFTYFQIT